MPSKSPLRDGLQKKLKLENSSSSVKKRGKSYKGLKLSEQKEDVKGILVKKRGKSYKGIKFSMQKDEVKGSSVKKRGKSYKGLKLSEQKEDVKGVTVKKRGKSYKGLKLSKQKENVKGPAVKKRAKSYNSTPSSLHPYGRNFEFKVDMGGYELQCIRVSNLSASVETETVLEGGNNDFPNLFTSAKQKNDTLVLEKAYISGEAEADFLPGVHVKSASITILRDGTAQKRLGFDEGMITKFDFTNLDAIGNEILMLKMEISHSGLHEIKDG